MFNQVLVGADPEVFVKKGGIYLSGHTFPCGTKERPRMVLNGSVQVDGLALEFNVLPSKTKVEFVDNVIKVYRELDGIVKEIDPEASLEAVPTVEFGTEFLDSLPKHVSELGCNPDYNAYSMMHNPVPNCKAPIRTGSGHVHVGFTEGAVAEDMDHFEVCADIVRELDYYLGLPSLEWDTDDRRRSLYGRAGAFRPKSYGVEYRVLSNTWLKSEELMAFVYDRTIAAMDALKMGKSFYKEYGDLAARFIDNNLTNWVSEAPEGLRTLQYK